MREAAEGKPVEIGLLQRYATDAADGERASSPSRAARRPASGSPSSAPGRPASPARIASPCSATRSTIFEARTKPGGLNEYGIAAYKTRRRLRRSARSTSSSSIGGIEIEHGKALGRDLTLADLRRDYDAVFLGIGLAGVNALGADGEDARRRRSTRSTSSPRCARRAISRALPVGRRVVVIGGGMTAIDAAVQSKRLGAEEVTIVYRRGPEQMKASRLRAGAGADQRRHDPPLGAAEARSMADGGTRQRRRVRVHAPRWRQAASAPARRFALDADMVFKAIGQTLRAGRARRRGRSSVKDGRIVVDAERRTIARRASGPAATASPAART